MHINKKLTKYKKTRIRKLIIRVCIQLQRREPRDQINYITISHMKYIYF
jgi:hypothetical protein